MPFSLWDSWLEARIWKCWVEISVAVLFMRFWVHSSRRCRSIHLWLPFSLWDSQQLYHGWIPCIIHCHSRVAVLFMRFGQVIIKESKHKELPFSLWDSRVKMQALLDALRDIELPFSLWDSYLETNEEGFVIWTKLPFSLWDSNIL